MNGRDRRDFEAEKRAWYSHVGYAMLAMGELEHLVVIGINLLAIDHIPRTIKALGLRQRLLLLREIVLQQEREQTPALLKFIDATSELIEERNLIAHNSLYFVTDDLKGDDFYVMSLTADRRIALAEVEAFGQRATAAAAGVFDLIKESARDRN